MSNCTTRLLLASLSLTVLTAAAQPAPPPQSHISTRSDPLDATSRVPAVNYKSSLKVSPKPDADGPSSWREANEKVARIGGWRVYARESQERPADAKPAPPNAGGTGAGATPPPGQNPAAPPASTGFAPHHHSKAPKP